MSRKVSVLRCVRNATPFVFKNLGKCFFRGLPYLAFAILTRHMNTFNSEFVKDWNIYHFLSFGELFLIAIFAVSWHRFTAIESERKYNLFPFKLGLREMKFVGSNIAMTALMGLIALGVWKLSAEFAAATLSYYMFFIIPLIWMIIVLPFLIFGFFLYPAIALDQPIQIKLFINEGWKSSGSFLLATILGMFLIVTVGSVLHPPKFVSPQTFNYFNVIFWHLLILTALGIVVSASTIYFKETIGLEGQNES